MQTRPEVFRAVVESSPSGMLMADSSGTIVFVNRAIERIFGYERSELVGQPVGMLVPQVVREQHARSERQFAHHPQSRPLGAGRDIRGIRKDGVEIPVEIGLTPIVLDSDSFVLAFVVDISERKRAENQLKARERQLNAVVEAVNDIVFEFDRDFRYLNVWAADESKLAWPKADLVGKSVVEVLGEAAQPFLQRFQRVLASGVPETFEYSLTVPAGNLTFVAFVRRLAGTQGAPPTLCMGISDVTVLKKAEDALHESDRRLRALFETVRLIVLGLDSDANVNYVNPYFLEISGYRQEEVLGSNWFRFLPLAREDELRAAFAELLETGAHPYYRNPILTRSGAERLIAWHNTVTRDALGRPTGTLSIGEDITDHVQLEEQFRQSQKMEAVGQLAGGIAHDFNNLLSVITGYSELVRQSLSPEDARREDLAEVRGAVDRAAGLVRQLLAFSRRQVLQPQILDINDVVSGMHKMLRRTIGEDVVLTTSLAPDLPGVFADAGQLEQVILNLTVNARDAMPGGGRITIETGMAELDEAYAAVHADVRPGRYVLMSCSDTGHGMDEMTRSRIFEPFFTTKEPGRGTGLGLATVYGIVKQSDGHVAAYSEVGRGTTMRVYLPAVHGAGAPTEVDTATGVAPTGTETVLLVEDESDLRTLAAAVLRQYGYTVLQARNGAEAVAICRSHMGAIHLMLTDIVMPEMNGPEAAERVRGLYPGVRVLFMSGYADRAVTEHRLLDPNAPFLQKPFGPTDLALKVREALDA